MRQYQDSQLRHRYLRFSLIFFIAVCCLPLCSCQKKRIEIIFDLSSDSKEMDDLEVVDDDYQTALDRCQKRLEEVPEDSLEAAIVYKTMGGIYATYLQDGDTARSYIERAIEIDKRENEEVELARDYIKMSRIHISAGGEPQEGMEYLEMAEEICKRHGLMDGFLMAGVLSNRGKLYYNMGEYEKAIDCFEKSQERYINKQEEEITLYNRIGQAYLKLGKYEEAKEQYLKGKKLCEDRGDEYNLANVNIELGWLYCLMGDYESSITYYEEALEYFKSEGSRIDEALIYNNIASIRGESGWKGEQVIPTAVEACRLIETVIPETPRTEQSKSTYKHNLKVCYKEWLPDATDEQFETWYRETVLEGKDWNHKDEEG